MKRCVAFDDYFRCHNLEGLALTSERPNCALEKRNIRNGGFLYTMGFICDCEGIHWLSNTILYISVNAPK